MPMYVSTIYVVFFGEGKGTLWLSLGSGYVFISGPMLHSVAPKATVRAKPVQDIATQARPGSVNLPVAQAATPTAQAMVLVDHTTVDISPHPTAQAVPVNPTFAQLAAQVYLLPQLKHIYRSGSTRISSRDTWSISVEIRL